jgi:hypothetical protein
MGQSTSRKGNHYLHTSTFLLLSPHIRYSFGVKVIRALYHSCPQEADKPSVFTWTPTRRNYVFLASVIQDIRILLANANVEGVTIDRIELSCALESGFRAWRNTLPGEKATIILDNEDLNQLQSALGSNDAVACDEDVRLIVDGKGFLCVEVHTHPKDRQLDRDLSGNKRLKVNPLNITESYAACNVFLLPTQNTINVLETLNKPVLEFMIKEFAPNLTLSRHHIDVLRDFVFEMLIDGEDFFVKAFDFLERPDEEAEGFSK